jgi:hypothetical protein
VWLVPVCAVVGVFVGAPGAGVHHRVDGVAFGRRQRRVADDRLVTGGREDVRGGRLARRDDERVVGVVGVTRSAL